MCAGWRRPSTPAVSYCGIQYCSFPIGATSRMQRWKSRGHLGGLWTPWALWLLCPWAAKWADKPAAWHTVIAKRVPVHHVAFSMVDSTLAFWAMTVGNPPHRSWTACSSSTERPQHTITRRTTTKLECCSCEGYNRHLGCFVQPEKHASR